MPEHHLGRHPSLPAVLSSCCFGGRHSHSPWEEGATPGVSRPAGVTSALYTARTLPFSRSFKTWLLLVEGEPDGRGAVASALHITHSLWGCMSRFLQGWGHLPGDRLADHCTGSLGSQLRELETCAAGTGLAEGRPSCSGHGASSDMLQGQGGGGPCGYAQVSMPHWACGQEKQLPWPHPGRVSRSRVPGAPRA